jgi:hypothetical protein
VIHRRKPQFSKENLAAIRAAYADFAGEFDLKILDTSVSVEKTLADFQRNYLNRILDQVEKHAEAKA